MIIERVMPCNREPRPPFRKAPACGILKHMTLNSPRPGLGIGARLVELEMTFRDG